MLMLPFQFFKAEIKGHSREMRKMIAEICKTTHNSVVQVNNTKDTL